MRELCKDIGQHYGEFFEENEQLCIDTGESVFRYDSEQELLLDWMDTLIEETVADGSDWSSELQEIAARCNKSIRGVRIYFGKKRNSYTATIDLPKNKGSKKTLQFSCGTFNTLAEALKARSAAEEARILLRQKDLHKQQLKGCLEDAERSLPKNAFMHALTVYGLD